MIFKKTLLAASLALVLTACGNDNASTEQAKNDASKTDEVVKEQVEKPSVRQDLIGEAQAKEAERLYRKLNEQYGKIASSAINQNNYFKGINVQISDYQAGDQSATAVRKLEVALNPDIVGQEAKLIFTSHDTIDYSDALNDDEIIAKINSEFMLEEGLDQLDINERGIEFVTEILSHVKTTQTLHHDEKISQDLEVTPIEVNEEDFTFKYDGFVSNSRYDQIDSARLIHSGTSKVSSGELNIADTDGFYFKLLPFTGESAADGADNLDVKTSAIDVEMMVNNRETKLHTEGLNYKAEKFHYDDYDAADLGIILGRETFKFNQVSVDNDRMPEMLEFKVIGIEQSISRNDELLTASYQFSADPITDIVAMTAGMPGLKINHADFGVSMDKVSIETARKINDINYRNQYEQIDSEFIPSVFDDMLNNNSTMSVDANVNTEAGDASAHADIRLKDGASLSDEEITQMQENEYLIQEILSEKLEIIADIRVAKSIVETTGMSGMVENQAGQYLEESNGNYVLHIEASSDGVTVNGKSIR